MPGTLDDKVLAILDGYHARMRDEQKDRSGGIDRRLLAVGPETGQLLHILARSLKAPNILELGTSYGYSGIWLADAARAVAGRVTTMELQDYKSAYARDMATKAGLAGHIEFKVGDAVKMIGELPHGI